MSIAIRPATPADVRTILHLIRELAIYEREPNAAVATADDLLRDGFGPSPAFQVLLAERAGTTIGFAFYFFSYSTWRGRRCLYLEDLFVLPEARGSGAGVSLMRALARVALDNDCPRFIWQVLDWNEPSIAFYEKLGAKVLREWLTVRLEGDALERLAAG
ncbi:MAG TPA: GNAT family N-acetyltransferase [Labilithrix sp.]|jgi:GNAT superfamily N-acetyltransferase|nr:GNAT family N-acetyltransferase [Labilithrix sp.]